MKPVRSTWFALRLAAVFLWDLLVSGIQVARAALSPRDITHPRFVTVPLRAASDLEITLVANFISLTPGTLSVDVSPDRRALLVHDLFGGDDSATTRATVRDGIEARVLAATRP